MLNLLERLKMINVLMIEDDPEFAQILSEYLSDFNIKVTLLYPVWTA